jgi:membrane protease YdiL (CAAX protease family)
MFKRMSKLDPMPPWGYLSALGAFVVMFLGILVGSAIIATLFPDNSPPMLLAGWGIGMVISIFYIFTSHRRSPEEAEALRMGITTAKLPIIALWSLGFAILFDLIGWAVANTQTLASAELLAFSGQNISLVGWIIAGIFMILLQPLGEELVFRGVMFPAFRGMFGAWMGFWMVVGFHTLFHFLAYQPATPNTAILLWYGAGLPFLDAVIITGVRAYTGSTRASLVAHAVFGAFALIKAFIFA